MNSNNQILIFILQSFSWCRIYSVYIHNTQCRIHISKYQTAFTVHNQAAGTFLINFLFTVLPQLFSVFRRLRWELFQQMLNRVSQESVLNNQPKIKNVKSNRGALFWQVEIFLQHSIYNRQASSHYRHLDPWMSAVSALHQFSPLMSKLDSELYSCHQEP